jgi:hypothetical protein
MLPLHVYDPIVLLVELAAAQLAAILEGGLVDLAMQGEAALGAEALPAPGALEALHMVVALGVVLLLHGVGEKSAAGLTLL